MRLLSTQLAVVLLISIGSAANTCADDNFHATGSAYFWNIQNSLAFGEPTYYVGEASGDLLGQTVQSGSIQPTSPPLPNSEGNLEFTGVPGPNPFFHGLPIHVINTRKGMIFCTWEAVFTIAPQPSGNVIFRGDGHFTVLGGTRRYRNASGEFTTLFATGEIPLSSDTASAGAEQFGTINR